MYERLSVRTVLATAFLFTMVGAGCGASSHNAASAGGAKQAAAAAAVPAAKSSSAPAGGGGSPCDFMKNDPISGIGDATSVSDATQKLHAEADFVRSNWPSALHDAQTIAKTLDKVASDLGGVSSKNEALAVVRRDVDPKAYAPVIQHLVAWTTANCS